MQKTSLVLGLLSSLLIGYVLKLEKDLINQRSIVSRQETVIELQEELISIQEDQEVIRDETIEKLTVLTTLLQNR